MQTLQSQAGRKIAEGNKEQRRCEEKEAHQKGEASKNSD